MMSSKDHRHWFSLMVSPTAHFDLNRINIHHKTGNRNKLITTFGFHTNQRKNSFQKCENTHQIRHIILKRTLFHLNTIKKTLTNLNRTKQSICRHDSQIMCCGLSYSPKCKESKKELFHKTQTPFLQGLRQTLHISTPNNQFANKKRFSMHSQHNKLLTMENNSSTSNLNLVGKKVKIKIPFGNTLFPRHTVDLVDTGLFKEKRSVGIETDNYCY